MERLIPLVYDELCRLARYRLQNQSPGHTLQPTALVHEAFIRLVERSQPEWRDRAHFFAVAGKIMRQLLVDYARAKCAGKRGGGSTRVEFKDTLNYSDEKAHDLLVLDDAMKELATFHERKARALELRYFSGLSVNETAEVLSISVETVRRDIQYGEAWLRRRMQKP